MSLAKEVLAAVDTSRGVMKVRQKAQKLKGMDLDLAKMRAHKAKFKAKTPKGRRRAEMTEGVLSQLWKERLR